MGKRQAAERAVADTCLVQVCFDKVGKAQEGGDGYIFRLPVQVLRAVELLENTVMEDGYLVGDTESLGLVVGDEDSSDRKFLKNAADFAGQAVPEGSVEGAEWLIKKQQLRLGSKASGQCHPLALTARQFVDTAVAESLESHQFEHGLDPIVQFARRALLHFQAEGDVLPDIFMGEKGILLEHHAEISLVRWNGRDIAAAKVNGAGIIFFQTGDEPQQSGLARAGGTEQTEDLALLERKADIPEERRSLVAIAEVLHRQDVVWWCTHGLSPAAKRGGELRQASSLASNQKPEQVTSIRRVLMAIAWP